MLHLLLELFLGILVLFGDIPFDKIDRVTYLILHPFFLLDTPSHELIYVAHVLYTGVILNIDCLILWNSTLNRVLEETLIVIKYFTFGSFSLDLIDVVLQYCMVILR
jgi:hypothetical protein